MRDATDVLVVGGGPVGLMLAGELQRRGVDHLLIEQKPAPSYFVKALGVSPRMLEIWDLVGIAREAIDAGMFLRGSATPVNGDVVEQVEIPEGRFPYGPLVLAQFETERILRARLLGLGGAIHAGLTLTSFDARSAALLARVRGADGERAIECRYLVGCDGAHSAVRHGLGLAYEGEAYPMTFMLGDVAVDWSLPRGYAYRGAHVVDGEMRNAGAMIPIPGDRRRYRVSLAAPDQSEGADLDRPPSLELLTGAAAPLLPKGARLSNLRWSSFYRISHRIVPRYGAERIFIAGDAAHIHPPIGGQGMNTGLQDAFNLGWKLALAAAGRGAADLLDGYGAERQPVGAEVVSRTSGRMAKTIEGKDKDSADELMADSQLLVNYRGSRWVGGGATRADRLDGPRPGDRAPDVQELSRHFVARPIRLFELMCVVGHTLLFYADESAAAQDFEGLAAFADDLSAGYPGAVAPYAVVSPGARPLDLERVPLIVDAQGGFRSAYGAHGGSVYLIRPDGYIGYRAATAAREPLLAHVRRVLGPPVR